MFKKNLRKKLAYSPTESESSSIKPSKKNISTSSDQQTSNGSSYGVPSKAHKSNRNIFLSTYLKTSSKQAFRQTNNGLYSRTGPEIDPLSIDSQKPSNFGSQKNHPDVNLI